MKAQDVAKYIINKAIKSGKPISNLQLQKILYFVHIGYLKENKKKLITDENFQAWQYGPVIESVYSKFRIYGAFLIEDTFDEELLNDLSSKEIEDIDKIIKDNLALRPWQLVERSHTPGGAWDKVYQDGKGDKRIIPDYLINAEASENGKNSRTR